MAKKDDAFINVLLSTFEDNLLSRNENKLISTKEEVIKPPKTDEEVWKFVKEYCKIPEEAESLLTSGGLISAKDSKLIDIELIPQQLEFITDFYFERQRFGILWKSRGGGGSLTAAIMIFLKMLFQGRSFADMAGSKEQATNLYEYVKFFAIRLHEKFGNILDGEPSLSKTKFKNGATLKCCATSETSARGKHPAGLVADESCQRDKSKDTILESAISMVFAKKNPIIVFLSTFHIPTGIFAYYWDHARKKGFKRYKWSVFDTMKTCYLNIDCKKCVLTDKRKKVNKKTGEVEIEYYGCNGTARESKGWKTFNDVVEAKRAIRKSTWEIEFACERPRKKGFDLHGADIDNCFTVKPVTCRRIEKKSVGIDWGQRATVVWLTALDYYTDIRKVIDVKSFSKEDFDITRRITILDKIEQLLEEWEELYGVFDIYSDISHQFNNQELMACGFSVIEISFKAEWKWLDDNYCRHFELEKILIPESLGIKEKLKKIRRDETGKIIKTRDERDYTDYHDACALSLKAFPLIRKRDVKISEGSIYVKRRNSKTANKSNRRLFVPIRRRWPDKW